MYRISKRMEIAGGTLFKTRVFKFIIGSCSVLIA